MQITLKDLTYRYVKGAAPAALDGVTALIGPGVHLLLGENGCRIMPSMQNRGLIENGKNICAQVTDLCLRRIADGTWVGGERIPSTKELALELGVNNRTVMKAYDELLSIGLTYIQRGMGYYCHPDVKERLMQYNRSLIVERELPRLVARAKASAMTLDELQEEISKIW